MALETGYRENELRSLTVRALDVFGAFLPLGADYTKNRKDARQPISRDLADRLRIISKGKPKDAPLLDIPKSKAWSVFREDLKTAKIDERTDEGLACWHSLRKTFVTAVLRSGADVKTAMGLARHSVACLTMDEYAAADMSRMREASQRAHEALTAEIEAVDVPHVFAKQAAGAETKAATSDSSEGCGDLPVVGASGHG